MKLDNTLEEIILRNKTLTEDKFRVTREYFELRLQQEDKLSKLSQIQSEQINANKTKLKMIKNISMEKIHKFSVKYKKAVSSDNVDKIIKMTFEDLISEFDYNCIHHYENNKDIIVNYINEVFKLHLYALATKKALKVELKSFSRNISSALLIQLVSEYNIFKRNIEVAMKLDYNLEEFKSHLEEQQTLEPIITEIFLKHLECIRNKNYIKDIIKENNTVTDIKINDKVNKNINIIKKEEKKEDIIDIYVIVSNAMKNMESSTQIVSKDHEETQNKNSSKDKLTKKQQEIKKANKEMGLVAARDLFKGLIK